VYKLIHIILFAKLGSDALASPFDEAEAIVSNEFRKTAITKGVSMSVRKNFTMPEHIAEDLEYLAKKLDKKQSQVIQDLIEEKVADYELEKKLESLEKLSGMFTGMFPKHVDIQWIKANSDN